ncbi:Na(+)/H(+) antiporter subunit B [Calditrichota bacterium LG25]
MIKRIISFMVLLGFAFIFGKILINWLPMSELNGVARAYVEREPHELGAVNVVTAIVVTYRGLDTLGEVSVLFLAATGVALLLRRRKKLPQNIENKRPASELLKTGSFLLMPFVVMFGVYIFINGHLSPGGGFQGGAVIASAMLLMLLTFPDYRLNHTVLGWVESASGVSYVLVGVLGLLLAGGFLDNRILPLGTYGAILSAGAIPLIYVFIGLKVGAELAGMLENLKQEQ